MYPTDVSQEKWSLIEDLFKRTDPRGKKNLHEKRDLFNAMLYVVKTGCQWRMLPKDLRPWPAVYSSYRRWTESGLFEAARKRLNIAYRQQLNRHESPSLGILDSQSTKTANVAELKGFDGNKKIKGRKRHIVVDSLGNLLYVKAHPANIHDTIAGASVMTEALKAYPSL